MEEKIIHDCYRGCVKIGSDDGLSIQYREGCSKLAEYNHLKGISPTEHGDLFEVRFKNTRKGFYRNGSAQSIHQGDLVVVEATTGHDVGIVTLEGPMVLKQMKCRRVDPENPELKKILYRAHSIEISRWLEACSREQETMIEARRIAATMGLNMKIGDVEFQGDGSKAIFYYIADARVDFRQLIKVFAEEFKVRIEMKQIGARQEAGLIGGIGVCGRELCCASFVSNFKSISTAAARCQDLSLNPQKLAGQCGKLKCCINYEVATYLDAQSRIPKVTGPLEFKDGLAYLKKTDILAETMYFSYDKSSEANLYPLSAEDVHEIILMNREGIKPDSLLPEPVVQAPEFVTAVGEGSISRFDRPKKKKNRKGRKGPRPDNNGQ